MLGVQIYNLHESFSFAHLLPRFSCSKLQENRKRSEKAKNADWIAVVYIQFMKIATLYKNS